LKFIIILEGFNSDLLLRDLISIKNPFSKISLKGLGLNFKKSNIGVRTNEMSFEFFLNNFSKNFFLLKKINF